jgi:hypothetical protein
MHGDSGRGPAQWVPEVIERDPSGDGPAQYVEPS